MGPAGNHPGGKGNARVDVIARRVCTTTAFEGRSDLRFPAYDDTDGSPYRDVDRIGRPGALGIGLGDVCTGT